MMKNSIDLFCTVIDNYGDAGVTYRLAQIMIKIGYTVNLFIDNFSVIKKLNTNIKDYSINVQGISSVQEIKEQQISQKLTLRYWIPEDSTKYNEEAYRDFSYTPSQIIIETFQCKLPKEITKTFTHNTVWINLEYLSAEKWVEDCHKLQSFQINNIKKYFFFPGFTAKTGCLNYDENFAKITKNEALCNTINEFKNDSNISEDIKKMFKVLIFTYENKALIPLLRAIIKNRPNSIFFLPKGKSTQYLENNKIFNQLLKDHPTVKTVKFEMINQEKFDDLMKAMDLNVVRGEDSFAQANITGTPFLWHIYPQDEDTHLIKLKAFTDIYAENCTDELRITIEKAFFSLNQSDKEEKETLSNFNNFMIKYKEICTLSAKWSDHLLKMGNLGRQLDSFIQKTQNILKVNK